MSEQTVWLVINEDSTPWEQGLADILGIYWTEAGAKEGKARLVKKYGAENNLMAGSYEEDTRIVEMPVKGEQLNNNDPFGLGLIGVHAELVEVKSENKRLQGLIDEWVSAGGAIRLENRVIYNGRLDAAEAALISAHIFKILER